MRNSDTPEKGDKEGDLRAQLGAADGINGAGLVWRLQKRTASCANCVYKAVLSR